MLTDPEEYYLLLQKKLHVITQIASSYVTQWLNCIVANVGTRLSKEECVEQTHSVCYAGAIFQLFSTHAAVPRTTFNV